MARSRKPAAAKNPGAGKRTGAGRNTAVVKYHNRVAGRYDHIYDDGYWALHDALTWDHLKGFLPSRQRAEVLDVGCGTGKWGIKLLHAGYRVTFVDISGAMVQQARRKVERIGRADRAEFLIADVCDLKPLAADRYVLAVGMGEPICLAASPARAVKELVRVLVTDGVLVATFDNQLACIDHYLEHGTPEELEAFLRTGRTRWLTRDKAERFEIQTFSPAGVRKLLTDAGLAVRDLVGKTVLDLRSHRADLTDPDLRKRLARIEKRLWRDQAALGRCSHLQAAGQKIDRNRAEGSS